MISQNRTGVARYYHHDGLGSVRVLSDSTQVSTDTYTFDAFGNLTGSTGTTANEFLFTGEQFDLNTGFYYLRARYMDSSIGRFISADKFPGLMFEPVTLHKYLYANANPVNMTDPSGFVAVGLTGPIQLNLSAATAAVGLFQRFLLRLILALGTAALPGSEDNLAIQAAAEDARAVVKDNVTELSGGSPVLFHYTDGVGVKGILGCSCIFASAPYFSHPDQIRRFSGAYATQIEPWLEGMTQKILGELLYAKPRGRVLTHFVAVEQDLRWAPVVYPEYFIPAFTGTPVPVTVFYGGASPMDLK